MSELIDKIKALLSSLRQNKKVIFIFILSTIVSFIFLFPTNDLNGWISSKANELTQGKIFFQFDKMNLSFSPSPGIKFKTFSLEASGFPPIKADELIFTPNIPSLLALNPGGSAKAKGFLNGQLEVSAKGAGTTEKGSSKQKIQITGQKLSLGQLTNFLSLPIPIQGLSDLSSVVTLDPDFHEQPNGDMEILIRKFALPPASVNTPMGPLTLPHLQLSQLSLTGKLKDGQFQIAKAQLGNNQDELYGNINGSMAMSLTRRGQNIVPILGSYSFTIDLVVKEGFSKRAGLFLSFLDQYKSKGPGGAQRYALKISGPRFGAPPKMSRTR